MAGFLRETVWVVTALAVATLGAGCFDSHCPEGDTECIATGGGGGGGGGDGFTVREICLETCDKSNECFDVAQECDSLCRDTEVPMECTNRDELFEALHRCNEGSCGPMGSTYSSCLSDLPPCEP